MKTSSVKNIFALLILLSQAGISQAQSPGGVVGYLYRGRPGNGAPASSALINNHPVHKITAPLKCPAFSTRTNLLKGFTIFCVARADSSVERALWSLQTDSATKVVVTNRRMAHLQEFRYINFDKPGRATPQIITLTRKGSENDSIPGLLHFYFGDERLGNLPVSDFEGLLPEVIVYDRRLSFIERSRVESYLALKYGISLRQAFPTSYLNSRGEVIWDAFRFGSFSGSIAGLGRDDNSGLNLEKSGSMEVPGLLQIEMSGLNDREFLIWGDNKEPLSLASKRGEGKKLRRRWVIVATGNFSERLSNLYFSASELEHVTPLARDEIFWLAVDQSGTGKFPAGQTRFYPNKSGNNRDLKFEGISWDGDRSGHDLFTLKAAPELFAAFEKSLPSCKTGNRGDIAVKVAGGTAPYQVTLFKEGVPISRGQVEGELHAFKNLAQGIYRVTVVDFRGATFSEEFLLPNADMAQLPFFEPLWLSEGVSMFVDASAPAYLPPCTRFEWQTPAGETIHGPGLNVATPGIYHLKVTGSDGCTTLREMEVMALSSSYFSQVEVYPNPTIDGTVYLRVQLQEVGPVQVRVTSASGQQLARELLTGASFYSFQCYLPGPGTWFITLEGDGERRSFKIIRE